MGIRLAVQITEKLYATRETVQVIYGPEWRAKLKPFIAVLEGLHKEKGLPYLTLGQQVAEDMQAKGINPLLLLAAMVELIEPTPSEPTGV